MLASTALVLAAACKNRESHGGSKDRAQPTPSQPARLGPIATLTGPAAALRFAMSQDEAMKAMPSLSSEMADQANPERSTASGMSGDQLVIARFVHRILTEIDVVDHNLTIADIAQAWGKVAPMPTSGTDDVRYAYVSGDRSVRARVLPNARGPGVQITFTPIKSLAELFGETPAMTLEGVQILGVKREELAAALQAKHLSTVADGKIFVINAIPGTEWGAIDTMVCDLAADGTVTRALMIFKPDMVDAKDVLLRAIARKYGTASADDDGRLHYSEGNESRIVATVTVHSDEIGVDVGSAQR